MSSKHILQLLLNSFISFAFIASVLPLRFFFGTVYVHQAGIGDGTTCPHEQLTPTSTTKVLYRECKLDVMSFGEGTFGIGTSISANFHVSVTLPSCIEALAIEVRGPAGT